MSGEPTTAAEQAALKQEFDDLRQRVDALESHHEGVMAGLARATGLSRRQLMAVAATAGSVGALGALGTQPAAGAAQDSGGEGDVGQPGSPFEGFADGLAMVTQSVNTSTTINKPIVLADPALGSLTLDISSDLEGPSGFSQMVTVIDQTGNAGTNSITVNASDGTTIATIDSDDVWFTARWDSGEWSTKRFIPTVEASTVRAEGLVIDDTYHWASQYDGADADARLDAAISAASSNDVIFLEGATYTDDRTITKALTINAPGRGTSPEIRAAWTLQGQGSVLDFCRFDFGNGGAVNVEAIQCLIRGGNMTGGAVPITVSSDLCIITGNDNISVTFEAGTSNGVVDGNTRASVTDNGSNTVGDNS